MNEEAGEVPFFELLFKVYFNTYEYVTFSVLIYLRPVKNDSLESPIRAARKWRPLAGRSPVNY